MLEALREAHARGATLLSLCSGAFILGAAGLLDGRKCTTHWRYVDELARRFPKAEVDPAVHFATLAVLVGVAAVLATRSMPDQAADEPDETGELLGDECAAERHVPKQRALIRDPRLIGLGVMTFCAAWAEGAANDWLALMLTDDRGASEALAALGFAVFAGAMTLGRVAGNQFVASLGRVLSLRVGAVVALVTAAAVEDRLHALHSAGRPALGTGG